MLTLAGLGLWDEKDISLRGLEACRKADTVYCELYTAAWGGDLRELEKIIGKKIILLKREDMEDDSSSIIKKSESKRVVVLIPGDPLTATTHIHLLQEAKGKGVETEVIHSSSILTAVGRTGLQLYKFGRVATIPTPAEGFSPKSWFEPVETNMKAGLHTLLLLDRDMDTARGLELLEKADWKGILKGRKIVVCSRLGSQKEKIMYETMKVLKGKNFPSPAVIIIPAKLHFSEEEFLENL